MLKVKDEVLKALLGGETLSGEALANRLGVTRAAVWKAVKSLRADGYPIMATTNRGYSLGAYDRLSEEGILHYGAGGFSVELHERIDSTNSRAKLLASEGKRNFCVIADHQTGGRGRMGRSFFSSPGSGLYLSAVLEPDLPVEDAVLTTTYAAVAVAESIEELTGSKTGIKWVNDIWIGDKKVCGILSEASAVIEMRSFAYIIVGIGINVRKTEFPPELSDIATDLESATGVQVDRNRLAATILQKLSVANKQLRDRSFLDRYRARCFVLGRELLVTRGGERFTARAVGVNDRGELLVETENGPLALQSGEVSTKVIV